MRTDKDRAKDVKKDMETALNSRDIAAFEKAYRRSFRYLKCSERLRYYHRFIVIYSETMKNETD